MSADGLFRAFADPLRLRILSLLLAEGEPVKELCVCDLCAALAESQPKVSRHLAILRRAGLVDVRRDGRWKYYALAQPRTPLERSLIRCVGSCLAELPDLERDRERLAGLSLRTRCDEPAPSPDGLP